MTLDFPASPSVNDTYTFNGRTWIYNGTGWALQSSIPDSSITNSQLAGGIADSKLNTISTAGKVANSATTATNANTASAIVARDASGNFSAGTVTAALSGNASTATTWQTGRTLTVGNTGKSVNGSAAVSWSLAEIGALPAAGGTLTGNLDNSSTGYMRVSVGTTAQRPGSPAQGMIRFNTSRGCFEGYTGTAWVNMSPLNVDDVGATA